ncbi:hypothetical protein SLS56_001891 [Neofusicoccum ribis]|uniref:Xylanolytic transcriptional activator regulatory domain-containing protein n=1 Tax=Neofusicoccum ribis TaxID=45134 RepID=A0ABR3T785_9PEZI
MQPATAFLPDDLDFMPDDFSSFLDSIPQNMSQPFQSDYPLFPVLDLNGFSTDSINRTQDPSSETLSAPAERQARRGNQGRAEVFTSYDKSEFDLSRFGSRLPSLEPEEEPVKPAPKTKSTTTVTSACREEVLRKLKLFSHVVSRSFILPSRHALSRFIFGYFTGFHEHYPMIHVPTFQLEEIPVDLFLAVAALGAQYCREPEQGLKLLRVAKAITLEKVHHQGPTGPDRKVTGQTQTSPCMSQCSGRPGTAVDISSYDNENDKPVCSLQCLILYVATATWFEDSVIAREAFSVLSLLDFLIREEGLKAPVDDEPASWESWIDAEMMKRTKLLGFCFFNLYTVLFNLPPLILSTEIELTLPSTEQEWRAKSAAEWESLRTTQPGFQAALRGLFEASSPSARYSSLGGYVLIHAIMQNIWLLQHTSKLLPRSAPPTLPAADVASFERALKAWCANWSQDHASSLDPISPHGPVPFNATALLRLAHIRISTPADAVQSLRSWDAARIARSLHAGGDQPSLADRSPRLTRAALHCAHALSVPVKLGINFVAHTQALYWSNQHALCALESAGLLARWLRVVAAVPAAALASEERRLLDFVLQMVAETQGGGGEGSERLLEAPGRLSAVVVRLWARLFRSDSVWEMVGLVGRVLEAYADLLEADAA